MGLFIFTADPQNSTPFANNIHQHYPRKYTYMMREKHHLFVSRTQIVNIPAHKQLRITRFSSYMQTSNNSRVSCVNKNISLQYFISPIRK